MRGSRATYDADDNSRRGYELAIKAAREKCIRAGQILPDPSRPDEVRWQREGTVAFSKLDAVKQ